MIVSRRSYLLSRPSLVIMAAAGGASAPKSADAIAQQIAGERFARLVERTGAKL
jgi:hypothetical protein